MADSGITRTSLSRRSAIVASLGMSACWQAAPTTAADDAPGNSSDEVPRTSLGLVIYCLKIRREHHRRRDPQFDLFHPLNFMAECVRCGAGGIQADLGSLTPAEAETLAERAAANDRFVEAILRPPMRDDDLGRFEKDVVTARRAGAVVARGTIIPGRRYEQFKSLDEFQVAERAGEAAVRRAIPVLARHGMKLAIENHKDQRNDERVKLFERIDSESFGACVDTGNSIALCEDPMETIEALAPWAMTVHLKDQSLARTPDGFLLADVPLGAGCLPLDRMVRRLKAARDDIRFSLELITRDPLRVPCLNASFTDVFENFPARDLAETIKLVEANAAATMPTVDSLSPPERLRQEEQNVVSSLRYAAEKLDLKPRQLS